MAYVPIMSEIPTRRLGALPKLTYGHLFGEPIQLPHLRGTGRSGLSPTFFCGPREPEFPTRDIIPQRESERQYQKLKLSGYTSATLHAMGALDKPDLKPPNLSNDVHPMFDKSMWSMESDLDLDNPEDGKFHAGNPIVWNALLPSLRLATKFLENAHCWPWWDALVNGEQKMISSPPASLLRSFHARPPDVVLAEGSIANEEFVSKFHDRVRFHIDITRSDWNDPRTGQITHASTMGYTQYLSNYDISHITMASQTIGPLLQNDITNSQRIVLQFQVAKTILHEFAHAIGFLLSVDQDLLQHGEPFFEDEAIRELGESMETAVCGGRIWSFPSNLSERALMMSTVQNWPNYALMLEKHGMGLKDQVLPGSFENVGPGAEQNVMAIPLSWMESLFQEEFWSIYVRQFGAEAIRPYPKLLIQCSVIASLDPATGAITRRAVTKFGADYVDYMASKHSPDVEMGGSDVASFAHYLDGGRVRQAYRQCAVLEQALAWYWAWTEDYGEC